MSQLTDKNFLQKLPLWAKIFGVILIISLISLPFASPKKQQIEEPKRIVIKSNADSLALLILKKEPKVKEVIFTDAKVCYVSVVDDNTKNRNGYADYICEVLRENKSSMTSVKIVEAGTTNSPNKDNAYGVLLGKSNCN